MVEAAESLHGHLGPFLVVGVKMGLLGLREIGNPKDNGQLHVTARMKGSTPFTCALDGIQVVTRCTIGNQRLKLESSDSSVIAAKFELKNDEREVTVVLKPEVLRDLEEKVLGRKVPPRELRRLALKIFSTPENELFIVKRR